MSSAVPLRAPTPSAVPAAGGAAGGGGGASSTAPAAGGNVKAVRAQLELAEQDCARVSAPDYGTPFSSLEDAVDRLLPFHMFAAEDPQQADLREVEAQPGAARLATTRHEAWQDFVMHKVNEYGAGLALLEKRIHKAEQEALQRSQLPLLMLQSYATAEAQALMYAEQQRPQQVAAEREAQRQAEQQRQQALLAEQMQKQMLAQQQQMLAQQQAQQAAAAAAAAQQQMLAQRQQQQQASASPPAGAVQQQGQAQALQRPGPSQPQHPMAGPLLQQGAPSVGGLPAGRPAAGAVPPGAGPPQHRPQQPVAPAKPLSAAEAKAKQLAALAARINQRK